MMVQLKNMKVFLLEHAFLRLLLENICEYYPFFKGKSFAVPKNAILSLTGPGMFTKTLREYLDANEVNERTIES